MRPRPCLRRLAPPAVALLLATGGMVGLALSSCAQAPAPPPEPAPSGPATPPSDAAPSARAQAPAPPPEPAPSGSATPLSDLTPGVPTQAPDPPPSPAPSGSAKTLSDAVPEIPDGPGKEAYLEALVLSSSGMAPMAAAKFEEAIRLEPGTARYYNNYAAFLLNHSDHVEDAVRVARLGLERAPGHAPLWTNLGIALQQLGRTEEALAALEQAVRLAPAEFMGQVWLGQACRQLALRGEPPDPELLDRSMRAMIEAARLAPENPRVAYHLGETLAAKGQYEEAMTAFQRAIVLAPEQPLLHQKVEEMQARLAEAATSPPGAE